MRNRLISRLRREERRLDDLARDAERNGTMWDHAYMLGKRNGVRRALYVLGDVDYGDHSHPDYEWAPREDEDD